uniref:Uncharacterized protein n=1 Tax=Plectus sambesii TaxID=2011161 RepID=A0A914VAZ0_9BILA
MPIVRKNDVYERLHTDSLAVWTYLAGAFSLVVYGGGVIYCTWAVTEHETKGFLDNTLSPLVWQTIWSFDLIMYAVGVLTTVIMMIGLLYVSRLSLIPWVLVSCVICAKHLIQLLVVLAFAQQNIPVIISSSQFAIALVQVIFIFIVLIKFDQIGRVLYVKCDKRWMDSKRHPKMMLVPGAMPPPMINPYYPTSIFALPPATI